MKGRIKLQIWSEAFERWKTVYVLVEKLHQNVMLLRVHGLKFRVVQEG